MNDPSNPGRVYNTDDRLKNTDREPPPKPMRKPDPSLRQLQRQISIGQDGTPLFFGSIKRKSATEATPTSPPAGGGGFSFKDLGAAGGGGGGGGGGAIAATVHLPPPVPEEDGLSGASGSRRGSHGTPPKGKASLKR